MFNQIVNKHKPTTLAAREIIQRTLRKFSQKKGKFTFIANIEWM